MEIQTVIEVYEKLSGKWFYDFENVAELEFNLFRFDIDIEYYVYLNETGSIGEPLNIIGRVINQQYIENGVI